MQGQNVLPPGPSHSPDFQNTLKTKIIKVKLKDDTDSILYIYELTTVLKLKQNNSWQT